MSFGLSHINTSALEGWQAIFVVEGAITLGLAPVVFFWVPSRIDRAFFLNEKERTLCRLRYEHNLRFYNPDDKFEWKYARAAALDWITWTSCVALALSASAC